MTIDWCLLWITDLGSKVISPEQLCVKCSQFDSIQAYLGKTNKTHCCYNDVALIVWSSRTVLTHRSKGKVKDSINFARKILVTSLTQWLKGQIIHVSDVGSCITDQTTSFKVIFYVHLVRPCPCMTSYSWARRGEKKILHTFKNRKRSMFCCIYIQSVLPSVIIWDLPQRLCVFQIERYVPSLHFFQVRCDYWMEYSPIQFAVSVQKHPMWHFGPKWVFYRIWKSEWFWKFYTLFEV